jgi:CBS domain-containing protein
MERRLTARDYMATDLVLLAPDTDLHQAMRALLERNISGAPVVDAAGNLVGLLSEKDCFRAAFTATYHREPGGRVSEYMSRRVETIDADMEIIDVVELFLRSPYRRFPVVEKHRLVGLLTRRDALRALEALW